MENIYRYSGVIATTIWGLVTENLHQIININITNEVGDVIYIEALWDGNGANVKLEIISDGHIINNDNLEGGSFETLDSFLFEALNVSKYDNNSYFREITNFRQFYSNYNK